MPVVLPRRRNVYLRRDAATRLVEPFGVAFTLRQVADLVGVPYDTFIRVASQRGPASNRTIADILTAADMIADRWGTEPPDFKALFEIKEHPYGARQ